MPKHSIMVASVILMVWGCGMGGERSPKDLERYTYKQLHMGVVARVVLYAPNQARADAGVQAAFARLAQLDDSLSDYRPQSAINRLSGHAGGPAVRVGTDVFRVLQAAQQLAEQTDGRFDVTVGPLTRVWRTAREAGHEPPDTVLVEARQRVGWRYLQLDSARQTVRLALPGMQLDLGGIAKGYAVGEAYRVLADQGLPRALVELGGDLRFGDPPPGRSGWTVQVPGRVRPLEVEQVFVSTSGATVQYIETERGAEAHVINTRTGHGYTAYPSVTVIAKENTDGLATVMGLLGEEAGVQFKDSYYPDIDLYYHP